MATKLTRQPQYPAQIDWSNPITRGLEFVQYGQYNSKFAAVNGPTNISISSGVAKNFLATSSQYLLASDTQPTGQPLTFFCLVRATSVSISNGLMSVGSTGADRHLLYISSSNLPAFFSANSGGNGQAAGASTLQAGVLYGVGARLIANNSRDVWVNGAIVGTDSTNVNVGATNRLAIGAYWNAGAPNAGFYADGAFPLSAKWNRALTDVEMRMLSANPWQIFRAKSPFILVNSDGGADVTVALTGQAATASTGTLAPSTDKALTGQAGTAGQGTVSVDSGVTVALTGQAATVSPGTLAPSTSTALTGTPATAIPGSLVASQEIGLTGAASTAAIGSLEPSLTVALSGSQIDTAQGTMGVVGDVTVALTGQSMVAGQGSLAVQPNLVFVDLHDGGHKRREHDKRKKRQDEDRAALAALFDPKPAFMPAKVPDLAPVVPPITDHVALIKAASKIKAYAPAPVTFAPADDFDDEEEALLLLM